MQPYTISEFVKARVLRRQGRLHAHETIDAARAALLVIDMQNYFVAEGYPAEGYRLFAALEALASDLYVRKVQYSAFVAGSSDLHEQLLGRGIESVLVCGTATNVCCESTARDAMMMDYRVIMPSDANAASSVEEHAAALDSVAFFFGDVMTVEEAIARLAK